jgi:hypothetical protein
MTRDDFRSRYIDEGIWMLYVSLVIIAGYVGYYIASDAGAAGGAALVVGLIVGYALRS